MSEAILYMSVSLDGFVAGPNEGPERTRILEGENGVTHMRYRVRR